MFQMPKWSKSKTVTVPEANTLTPLMALKVVVKGHGCGAGMTRKNINLTLGKLLWLSEAQFSFWNIKTKLFIM